MYRTAKHSPSETVTNRKPSRPTGLTSLCTNLDLKVHSYPTPLKVLRQIRLSDEFILYIRNLAIDTLYGTRDNNEECRWSSKQRDIFMSSSYIGLNFHETAKVKFSFSENASRRVISSSYHPFHLVNLSLKVQVTIPSISYLQSN